jgi:hypothetical protein
VSRIRVIVELDPLGGTVRGVVATAPSGGVAFTGWLELLQTLERLLGEAEPGAERRETEAVR